MRVGTQRLFRPYLKTYLPPFLLTRLTAPGSPRIICVSYSVYSILNLLRALFCCRNCATSLSYGAKSFDMTYARALFEDIIIGLLA